MNNLFKLEFRRLFRAKSFYICLGISLAMILVTGLTTKLILSAQSQDMLAAMGYDTNPPTALSTMKGIASSSLLMVLAAFVTLFVTEDYVGNTIKNIYSKGYSRDLVFFSKYVTTIVASTIIILANALFALLTGGVLFGEIGTTGHFFAGSVVAILFLLIVYVTIFFMVAICLRKVGGSLAICLVGPVVLSLILLLIDSISSKFSISAYWLDGILANLAEYDVPGKTLAIAFGVGFNMLAGSLLIGFFSNRKSNQ